MGRRHATVDSSWMRVSVVIPLFNKAGQIERTLRSVAAQTWTDFEILVVDDGSTDGGDVLAERFEDARIRVIRQENSGPGAARNRGLAEAQTEYIAFLDADDAWLTGFLEQGIQFLEAHPGVVSVSGAWYSYPGKISSVPSFSARGISGGVHRVTPELPVSVFDSMVSFMTPCTSVFRAAAVRECGGFQGGGCRFGEDGALWLKLLLNHPVAFCMEPLTEVHREDSGLSGNYTTVRPIEPYLSDPGILDGYCPDELRSLLQRFYAGRACKTACMLSYWGQWRRARQLLRQFVSWRDWRTPLFFVAQAANTPAGGIAGKLHRLLKQRAK